MAFETVRSVPSLILTLNLAGFRFSVTNPGVIAVV